MPSEKSHRRHSQSLAYSRNGSLHSLPARPMLDGTCESAAGAREKGIRRPRKEAPAARADQQARRPRGRRSA
jgi:hypothetical protein